MKIAIISFTKNGTELNIKLKEVLKEHNIISFSAKRYATNRGIFHLNNLKETVKDHFSDDAVIFIGAAGIAVRSIAPFLKDKFSDPAVIVIDELGQFVIPILSGHVGGSNELAECIAAALKAVPVITTATDVTGAFAIDMFAKKHNLVLSSRELAKNVSSAILDGKPVDFDSDIEEIDIERIKNSLNPDNIGIVKVRITYKVYPEDVLTLIPKSLCIGVGCKRDVSPQKMWDFISNIFKEYKLDIRAVRDIASIDLKKNERAILELAKRLGVDFYTYSKDMLSRLSGDFSESEFVRDTVGVGNVCERAALMHTKKLLVKKIAKEGMTVAIGGYKL